MQRQKCNVIGLIVSAICQYAYYHVIQGLKQQKFEEADHYTAGYRFEIDTLITVTKATNLIFTFEVLAFY